MIFVAEENKSVLASEEMVGRLVTFANNSDFTPVIFKVLATLRMIIAGQGSTSVLTFQILKMLKLIYRFVFSHPLFSISRHLSWK